MIRGNLLYASLTESTTPSNEYDDGPDYYDEDYDSYYDFLITVMISQ